jgi:hypothetical protein
MGASKNHWLEFSSDSGASMSDRDTRECERAFITNAPECQQLLVVQFIARAQTKKGPNCLGPFLFAR